MSKYIKINVLYLFFILCVGLLYFQTKFNSETPVYVNIETPICVPVNIETRSLSQSYSQLGILTCKQEIILPLMGRQFTLNKWQYYAVSNTATINTKLPMTFRGKKCSSEYGCDQLMNGDDVHVDGYQDTFYVTLYENEKLHYLPY